MECITYIPRNPSGIIVAGNLCDFIEYPKVEIKETRELYYEGIRSGSYKKVYILTKDSDGKRYISTDEPVVQKCKKLARDECIKYRFDIIKKEIVLHMEIFNSLPHLVPRIISVNVYETPEYRIQTLMENVNTDGYCIVNEYGLKFEITNVFYLKPYHKAIARCIFDNIKPIHKMGIVHGDLKIDNFAIKGLVAKSQKFDDMSLDKCSIRFIDFGLANRYEDIQGLMERHCDYLRTRVLYQNSSGEIRKHLDTILSDICRPKKIQEWEFYTLVGRHVKNLFLIGITWPHCPKDNINLYTYWDELFYYPLEENGFEETVGVYMTKVLPLKRSIVDEYLSLY